MPLVTASAGGACRATRMSAVSGEHDHDGSRRLSPARGSRWLSPRSLSAPTGVRRTDRFRSLEHPTCNL